MAELRWGATTDPGRIRPENEDNLLAEPPAFAVADGMGGHRAGEVASALAVDLLRSRLHGDAVTLDDVIAAVNEANDDIYRAAIANPDQQGMGTTITALVVVSGAAGEPSDDATAPIPEPAADGDPTEEVPVPDAADAFVLVNVGDSRTYLLRHGRLRRVTVDHSYVQELVATGHITDDEARTHPRRNIVTRALGIDPSVRVDAWTLPVVRGDRFLLCSDGLVDEVPDDDIVGVLTSTGEPQAAADELVELANRQGGRDNITVVVVDVLEGAAPPDPTTELDLEPTWQDATEPGTWAVDDPDGSDATEFADLAALVSGESPEAADETTAATTDDTAPDDDSTTSPPPAPRRRRRVRGAIAAVAVIAVLVLGFVIAAAWARRGYFVDFDTAGAGGADDALVVIYRGRPEGFLWFEPTEDAPTALTRSMLDDESIERVERRPTFGSLDSAEDFVAEQLVTTTTTPPTTTTTTTTTTVPPTTTTGPTTTAAP